MIGDITLDCIPFHFGLPINYMHFQNILILPANLRQENFAVNIFSRNIQNKDEPMVMFC